MEEGYEKELRKQEKYLLTLLVSRERREEIFWKQNSRNQWLQDEERNTNFFHNKVIQNRNRSNIHKLRKTNGGRAETREEIEEELFHHFKNVMTEDQANRKQDIERIMWLIPRVVTYKHNEMLTKSIDIQEVEEAMH